jgi:hypothetical protein
MINKDKIIEIFVSIDDFCQIFEPELNKKLIGKSKIRNKPSKLSMSEVMTIEVAFHHSGFKNFKEFYLGYVQIHLRDLFPNTVSYNRMTELCSASMLHLFAYLKSFGLGDCTGISFIDSTPLRVCSNRRIHQHKTFKNIAQRGQCSIGWFYGFKLHLIVNHQGGIVAAKITPANVHDTKPVADMVFSPMDKLYADKGYISKALSSDLLEKGVTLVTNVRKNMKAKAISLWDRAMLSRRFIIETINDQLKNISQIEHSRHRSVHGFMLNMIAGLIAYQLKESKPQLNITNAEFNAITVMAR